MSSLLRPLTILIVDESAMLRVMLKRVIQIAGVPLERVIEVSTAASGVAALEAHAVDVVFANVDRSQTQGYELLNKLQDRSDWHAVRRVATTTRAASVDDTLAALGVHQQVSTPFTPETVREAIRAVD